MRELRDCVCALAIGVVVGGLVVYKSKTIRAYMRAQEDVIMEITDSCVEACADIKDTVVNKTREVCADCVETVCDDMEDTTKKLEKVAKKIEPKKTKKKA
ncbi:MAG: hypothetical protein FWD89_02700 [Firmicutes bacterium]|nr:hypothetical protein [Bacillota bacterium]